MSNKPAISASVLALLLASACGGEQQNPAAQTQPEASPSAGNAVAASTIADNATAPVAEGPLSKYVGTHPSTPIEGTRFLDEASVRNAVAANVSDDAVRKFVFGYNGPDAPIAAKDGKILAWGCERHNCGYHNWSIAITPDGTSAEVCYYRNADRPDATSTWYLAGGKTEQRPGNCPSD